MHIEIRINTIHNTSELNTHTHTHSPDLGPNDLWLFPEIKSVLKGRRL